ncbi:MAG TPA: hypothetical protein VMU07_02345 [Candidatus Paceibacterota bacterium]|nr:hypothetical protein [Candidatus Paceibacterota bacterium]
MTVLNLQEEERHEEVIDGDRRKERSRRYAWSTHKAHYVGALALLILGLLAIGSWVKLGYGWSFRLHPSLSDKSSADQATNPVVPPLAPPPVVATATIKPLYHEFIVPRGYTLSHIANHAFRDARYWETVQKQLKEGLPNGDGKIGIDDPKHLLAGETYSIPDTLHLDDGTTVAFDAERFDRKLDIFNAKNEEDKTPFPSRALAPQHPAAAVSGVETIPTNAIPSDAFLKSGETTADGPLTRQLEAKAQDFGFKGSEQAKHAWAADTAHGYACEAGFTDCRGSNQVIGFNPPDKVAVVIENNAQGIAQIKEYYIDGGQATLERNLVFDGTIPERPFIGTATKFFERVLPSPNG